MAIVKIGIITVSDRAYAGVYEDISGKSIINTLNDYLVSEWEEVYKIVPDEQEVIEKKLSKWSIMTNVAWWLLQEVLVLLREMLHQKLLKRYAIV
ncbi:hypothetical protein [uncultured Aquimarina sp.]|uniref:hypothetical protein n=1 Tax=uncultured Aquimarina sp. TaxID=575652 RepID=UPI002635875B|nr:hypothetical protein [uncultured Aquimarina sp.]